MTLKSRFFRIGTEGDTSDGRVIERRWIQEMADTYDRTRYAARIWMEHIRGYTAEGPFRAYGDVLALQARQEPDGKLALYAQIEPLPELVSMNQAKQKLYTSMEIAPDFAKTGKAYLVGLAVTDSPASLGTELLAFAAQHPQSNPFAARKQDAANLFCAAQAVELTFEEAADAAQGAAQPATLAALTESVRNLFSKPREATQTAQTDPAPQSADMETLLHHLSRLDASVAALSASQSAQLAQLRSQFDALRHTLQEQDGRPGSQRPPATGGANPIQTDC